MKKLIASLMTASLLMPTVALASGPRRVPPKPVTSVRGDVVCMNEEEEFKERCKVVIDDTGVITPDGHITNVVQWGFSGEKYDIGAGIVGGAAGTAVGMGVGMATCGLLLPVCLFTLPAMTGLGAGVGGMAGGNNDKFFVVIGDDVDGNRLTLEFKSNNTGLQRKIIRKLIKTTGLAAGELKV